MNVSLLFGENTHMNVGKKTEVEVIIITSGVQVRSKILVAKPGIFVRLYLCLIVYSMAATTLDIFFSFIPHTNSILQYEGTV